MIRAVASPGGVCVGSYAPNPYTSAPFNVYPVLAVNSLYALFSSVVFTIIANKIVLHAHVVVHILVTVW